MIGIAATGDFRASAEWSLGGHGSDSFWLRSPLESVTPMAGGEGWRACMCARTGRRRWRTREVPQRAPADGISSSSVRLRKWSRWNIATRWMPRWRHRGALRDFVAGFLCFPRHDKDSERATATRGNATVTRLLPSLPRALHGICLANLPVQERVQDAALHPSCKHRNGAPPTLARPKLW